MNFTILRILIFCIDRGLRQFHLGYSWFVTDNADKIHAPIRKEIEGRISNFFSKYTHYVVFKVPKWEGEAGEAKIKNKIGQLLATALIGGTYIVNTSFVETYKDNVVVAGLKIDGPEKKES